MDFTSDGPTTELVEDARSFLREHLTDELRHRIRTTGTWHDAELHRLMADRGWLAAATAGSRASRGPYELAALFREMELADAPYHGLSTTMIVVGVLEQLASPQLKSRVLAELLAGDSIAVLGYSEPGSGSDVAAAATRAVPSSEAHESWHITGQKMWTTLAQEAGHVLLLTRTDAKRPKHLGLTMFLVPLNSPGITIQAIHTIADERTNVVFYDDVVVGDDCRIGEINGGWNVMGVALSLERGVMGGSAMLEPLVRDVARWAGEPDQDGERPADDPAILEALARARIDAEVAYLLTQRTADVGASGGSPAIAGNNARLFATTAYQRCARDIQEVVGLAGIMSAGGGGAIRPAAAGEVERVARHSAVTTIQGGTTEVQRNHVAQHVLGLPRVRGSAPKAPGDGPGR